MEVLVRVHVAVDEPRHEQVAREVDHRSGVVDAVGRLDGADPFAVDEDVERPALEVEPGTQQRISAPQDRARHPGLLVLAFPDPGRDNRPT